jgi:hypothetical protein
VNLSYSLKSLPTLKLLVISQRTLRIALLQTGQFILQLYYSINASAFSSTLDGAICKERAFTIYGKVVELGDDSCIDVACIFVYTAYMSNTQYTIRSVPAKVDQALRKRAKKTGKSLNEIAVEALAKGAGITPNATFDDLDWFIGSMETDSEFDKAMVWMDSLPKDMD